MVHRGSFYILIQIKVPSYWGVQCVHQFLINRPQLSRTIHTFKSIEGFLPFLTIWSEHELSIAFQSEAPKC